MDDMRAQLKLAYQAVNLVIQDYRDIEGLLFLDIKAHNQYKPFMLNAVKLLNKNIHPGKQ
jgi:hypothetical protein